jgi:hypothetical protein
MLVKPDFPFNFVSIGYNKINYDLTMVKAAQDLLFPLTNFTNPNKGSIWWHIDWSTARRTRSCWNLAVAVCGK